MNVAQLITELEGVPNDMEVAYPGAGTDHIISSIFVADGRLILSTEDESLGEPKRAEPPKAVREEGLEEAEVRGRGLLVIVHESYALLAAARPSHWLLTNGVQEATAWMGRQATLLKLIDGVGASPPPKPPENMSDLLANVLGVPTKKE